MSVRSLTANHGGSSIQHKIDTLMILELLILYSVVTALDLKRDLLLTEQTHGKVEFSCWLENYLENKVMAMYSPKHYFFTQECWSYSCISNIIRVSFFSCVLRHINSRISLISWSRIKLIFQLTRTMRQPSSPSSFYQSSDGAPLFFAKCLEKVFNWILRSFPSSGLIFKIKFFGNTLPVKIT